jgi:hypothetical protein
MIEASFSLAFILQFIRIYTLAYPCHQETSNLTPCESNLNEC